MNSVLEAEVRPAGEIDVPGVVIVGELGRGAGTVVYRVRRDGTDWAMKVRSGTAGFEPQEMYAFRREAALLALANHPALPRVHEVGHADGRPYLIMDLIEGRELAGLLREGPVPQDAVVRIGAEIADALAAAHQLGLVHRDIKPQNVMVQPDGGARLIDFGLATLASNHATDVITGTLSYAAPEQSGMLKRVVDARSDLYSVGIVLFECLTGRPPFEAEDVGDLIRMHATKPAPDIRALRPAVSAVLAELVAALLAKEPDDRYQNAAALAADLRRLAADPDAVFTLGRGTVGTIARRSPMIGRKDELTRLTSAWHKVRAGQGAVVLLHGAPGSGKSRLVGELADQVATKGFPALVAAAEEGAPLAPIRRAVELYIAQLERLEPKLRAAATDRLRAAAGGFPTHLSRLSPALADLIAVDGQELPPTAANDGGESFLPTVAGFLVALAEVDGGLLLVLDDVDRLDGATRRVLGHLALSAATAPLLVLCTVTGEAPDLTLDGLLQPGAVSATVVLEPFGEATAGRLIGALTDGLDLDDSSLARLAARGGRTPLEVIEYVAAVIDAGLLCPAWGTWYLDVEWLDRFPLPDNVFGLVTRRVEHLSSDSRVLLTVAAVAGLSFDVGLVAAAAGLPDVRDAADLLQPAVARGVLEHHAGRYEFAHERVRAVVLEAASDDKVHELHQRIAEELDLGGGDTDPFSLARHYLQGYPDRDPARVAHVCVAAGELALAHHAGPEAVTFLKAALELAESFPGLGAPEPARLQYLLIEAYPMAGQLNDALDAIAKALVSTTDPVQRALLLDRRAWTHKALVDFDSALHDGLAGLAELGRRPSHNLVWSLITTFYLYLLGRFVELTGIGFGTVPRHRRDRFTALAQLHQTVEEAGVRTGQPQLAVLVSLRGLYTVERLGIGQEYMQYHGSRAIVSSILGLPGVGRRLARVDRAAARLGTAEAGAYKRYAREVTLMFRARSHERDMLKVVAEVGHLLPVAAYLDGIGGACFSLLGRGHAAEARQWYQRCLTRIAEADVTTHNVQLLGLGAAALQGRTAEVDSRFNSIRNDWHLWGSGPLAVHTLSIMAMAAVEQRDLGADFEKVRADFAATGVSPRRMLRPVRIVFAAFAYGALERCRTASTDEFPERLDVARRAVRTLRRVPAEPIVSSHARVAAADLRLVSGDPRGALAELAKADGFLHEHDVPLALFEAERVRARACASLGWEPGALAHAAAAIALAEQFGWPHRVEWIRTEFRLADHSTHAPARARARSSVVFSSESATSSAYGRRLAALEQLSMAASRIVDPTELTRVALDQTIRILGAERSFLFLAEAGRGDRDGEDTLVPHAGRDAAGNDLQVLSGYGSSLVERVRTTHEPLVVTGTDEGAALGSQSAVVHGLRSIIVAPMLLDGRLIGVVYLDSRVARGMFTVSDVGTLTAITTHVAAALETARAVQLGFAVQAAQQQRDVAETLRDAMSELVGTLEPREVLNRLRLLAARILPATTSTVFTVDRDHLAALPVNDDVPSEPVPVVTGGIVDRLLRGTAPVVGDAADAAELPGIARDAGSWLAVPLRVRDEVKGLVVLAVSGPDAYGPAEIELAGALVEQAMVAYDNARLFAEVSHMAITDALTGVYNRRYFFDRASTELTHSAREGTPLTAMMLDIDHFKRVNDVYGHPVGDQVIQAVASRLTELVRGEDLLARYGGEEFALILTSPADRANLMAESIRAAVADHPVDTSAGPLPITVSLGIAHRVPGDSDPGPLLARADEALYRAKEGGRNQVHEYTESTA